MLKSICSFVLLSKNQCSKKILIIKNIGKTCYLPIKNNYISGLNDSATWLYIEHMKIPEKNTSGFLPENHQPFELIENQVIITNLPEERFEHWGFLVYSDITSKLINLALVGQEKISAN